MSDYEQDLVDWANSMKPGTLESKPIEPTVKIKDSTLVGGWHKLYDIWSGLTDAEIVRLVSRFYPTSTAIQVTREYAARRES